MGAAVARRRVARAEPTRAQVERVASTPVPQAQAVQRLAELVERRPAEPAVQQLAEPAERRLVESAARRLVELAARQPVEPAAFQSAALEAG